MKIVAGVLAWNPLTTGRKKLLKRVVDSLSAADDVIVFDNGSTDVYDLDAKLIKFPRLSGFPDAHTVGYAKNKMAASIDADVILLSDDDVVWAPEAIPTLRAVWRSAPDDVKIVSGLLEPTFALPDTEPWNLPLGTMDVAGHKLLLRKSAPGGAWTFRGEDKKWIFPLSTFPGVDDVPACHSLTAQGLKVAAMDLASHEGKESTWGNRSYQQLIHTPLEVVKAEFEL